MIISIVSSKVVKKKDPLHLSLLNTSLINLATL